MSDDNTLTEIMAAWSDMTSATASIHEALADLPREDVFESLVKVGLQQEHLRTAHVAAGALLALADVQAELAKTEANFEEYAESAAEENQRLRDGVARLTALASVETS